jgi:hypothetical protein
MVPDAGDMCNGSGHVGSHCRSMTCVTGATCAPETAATVQMAFGIPSGTLMDPAHPDYQQIDTSASAQTAPFNGFAGTFCLEVCNTNGDATGADMCGACSSCSTAFTQMPLIAAFGGVITGINPANRTYGADTGVCRLDCTYADGTRGAECPDDMSCDRFGNVCVEQCTSDNECNTVYGVTYEGELVTIVNDMNPDHCNATTGRCEFAGTTSTTATVGTHCESNADCSASGICLNGGHCAEFGCANPGTTMATCGGPTNSLGICLPTSNTMHPSALCLQGCNSATECGAGNICNTLLDTAGNVITIGTWTGYCIGVCTTDDECLAAESCTDYNTVDATSGAVTGHAGRCVPRCGGTGAPIGIGDVGLSTGTTAAAGDCLTTEYCAPDGSLSNNHACSGDADCTGMGAYTMCLYGTCHSAAPSFGQCQVLGAFCGQADTRSLPAHQGDCAVTQVCDETLATPHTVTGTTVGGVAHEQFGDGHCVNPCATTADCSAYPAGSECVTTGALTGLCRIPCTATTGTCPTDQTCDATLGYCVEVGPPTP